MKITILAVGKLKEKYWTEAMAEYVKRMGPFAKV
ncbi:MAG: 23S rRNA (pseudouridine(1915)-N(3))-methyltransferase RlmH, partial [Acidaminococcaceae bacterium]|nr:23S rRNA (pseudouridine(1915)-N(3))-methyltransferase RlmH [Acidaminococcaceae bacterium]